MNKLKERFPLLSQDGPFATTESVFAGTPFCPEGRAMVTTIINAGMSTKYRILRDQIFELLHLSSYAEIKQLINDRRKRILISGRAFALIGNLFGIEGMEREIISKVKSYSRTADGVIRYLRSHALSNYGPHVEMTNEIDALSDPIDLLLIVFNDRYHKKARFEAKRKLILMHLAGSIDQRERETEIECKFIQFLDFLNDRVWSHKAKIGELENVYLLSDHDEHSFSCRHVKVLTMDQALLIRPERLQKLTLIKRRRFQLNGREIPLYVSIRKKTSEAKVLKLLRKGEENPALAVDDELGLMAVLDSPAEVKIFQRHLTHSASRAKSFMTLEEIADTLAGAGHASRSIGSSPATPMLKFFARMGGMRVEFIVHTNKTYLDYKYSRDIAHDEYEIKRIFDSGVADLLFPRDIYHLDMADIRDRQISWVRKQIEGVV